MSSIFSIGDRVLVKSANGRTAIIKDSITDKALIREMVTKLGEPPQYTEIDLDWWIVTFEDNGEEGRYSDNTLVKID